MFSCALHRWAAVFYAMLGVGMICSRCVSRAAAVEVAKSNIDPRYFGLDVPPGEIRHDKAGMCVQARDDRGRPVVAKIHVQVGGTYILKMPDGVLVPRRISETKPTQERFEAEDGEEIAKRMISTVLGRFKGFKYHQTRHYLYLYNTSDQFLYGTSRILETMYPGVSKHARVQGIETHRPDVPMIVIMFRNDDQFQEFRRMPRGVLAYYHTVSNYTVMYELATGGRKRSDLEYKEKISTIAHEGAHQILHNIGVQQRLSAWPMWISEGLAEYFAPTSFGRRLSWKGAGDVNDLRMFELERYFKARPVADSDGRMVSDAVRAARLTSTGYAAAWSLTHYLAKRQVRKFHAFMRNVSQLRPLERYGPPETSGQSVANQQLFEHHFGDDYTEIEKRVILHLRQQRYIYPFPEYPHYVATVAVPAGRRYKKTAAVFLYEKLARKWQKDVVDSLSEDDRGKALTGLKLFPNQSVASRFAAQFSR